MLFTNPIMDSFDFVLVCVNTLQIPASFSIQLKRGDLELPLNGNRRLLNTEKLIFKSESDGSNDQVQFRH